MNFINIVIYASIGILFILFLILKLYKWENLKRSMIWLYRGLGWFFKLTKNKRRAYSLSIVIINSLAISNNNNLLNFSNFNLKTFFVSIGSHIITSEREIIYNLDKFIESSGLFSFWYLLSAFFIGILLFEWINLIRYFVTNILVQDASKSNTPLVWIFTFSVFSVFYMLWSLIFNFVYGSMSITNISDVWYILPFYSLYNYISINIQQMINKIPFINTYIESNLNKSINTTVNNTL